MDVILTPHTEATIERIKEHKVVLSPQDSTTLNYLVSMGDREADIYEIFLEAAKDPCGPKLLVRAEKSRVRKVEQEHLWQFMSGKEIAGTSMYGIFRGDRVEDALLLLYQKDRTA